MSRKYPKKWKRERETRLKAAEAFVEEWTNTGLASSFAHDYDCTFNCAEAETYGDLLRSFGYPSTAEDMMEGHLNDCDEKFRHEKNGAWTFTYVVQGPEIPKDTEYTVAMRGATGSEADKAAEALLRKLYKASNPGKYFYLVLAEVEAGVPGPLALYPWIDGRDLASAA
ncbi:hypothetical protein [Streptomyces sp. NPDC047990]|uniref:hypothetical protein n=1 Tax=Streptomyces sp. NPDC047990 TaxID=3365496 RepID=UPI003718B148